MIVLSTLRNSDDDFVAALYLNILNDSCLWRLFGQVGDNLGHARSAGGAVGIGLASSCGHN
jgi:hypothetical protein